MCHSGRDSNDHPPTAEPEIWVSKSSYMGSTAAQQIFIINRNLLGFYEYKCYRKRY